MEPILSDAEKVCVRGLASMLANGQTSWVGQGVPEQVACGAEGEVAISLLKMMESLGVIEITGRGSEGVVSFSILPGAIHWSRKLDKEDSDRKDILEYLKTTFRKHPMVAYPAAVVMAVVFVAAAITQIAGALKVFGIPPDAKP